MRLKVAARPSIPPSDMSADRDAASGEAAAVRVREQIGLKRAAVSQRVSDEWAARARLRLGIETAVSVALVALVLLLSLPGPLRKWPEGVETALQQPVVLIPLTGVCATALLWCVRAWVLRRRLQDPGPIQLLSMEDATTAPAVATTGTTIDQPTAPQTTLQAEPTNGAAPSGASAGAPVARLVTYLRQRLSELELTAPTVTPGRPTSTDFVELLGTTDLNLKQPLALVGKLLTLVLPTHAYELKATLLRRDATPQFGVAIEFTILPNRHTSFRTFWNESWEDALDRATSAVGALVVPLSRRSQRGPWCSWHGKALDDEIFHAYQRFQHLSRERRYEEAMEALYAALRRDPANHHLRFQLGLLQEELALYLDALLTYHSILQGLEERIRATTDKRERRAYEQLELFARYRATFLLGWGERLAEQFVPARHARGPTKRSRELAELRDQLRPILVARYRDIKIGPRDRAALGFAPAAASTDIETVLAADPDDVPMPARRRRTGDVGPVPDDAEKRRRRRALETRQALHRRLVVSRLRLLFQLCARHDVEGFLKEYSDARLHALDTEITPLALRMLPAWARLRAHSARHAIDIERERVGDKRASATGEGEDQRWPPDPETVRRLWREAAGPGLDPVAALEKSDQFLDHYNAACTFAVPLLQDRRSEPRPSGAEVQALSGAAVAELENAVRVAGSEKLASQWDWILKEDPDLAGVRAEPEFRRFESERFPSSEPSPVRPHEIVRLMAARHSARLYYECASRLERQWHHRADTVAAINPHEALRWWDDEREAWRSVRELSVHHHHWQTRLDVIRQMQRFCAAHDLGDFFVPQPVYAHERIDADPTLIDKAARREMHLAHERIRMVDLELDRQGHDRYCESWERYLQALDMAGQQLDEDTVRRLAVNRASAWGELRVAFARRLDSDHSLRAAQRELAAATGKLAALPAPLSKEGATAGGRRRLLVVADRTLDGEELRAELVRRARKGTEIHIVAPTLALNDRYDASDTDRALDGARERISEILDWAYEAGVRATGTVGDPNLAMGAIVDELASSAAEEILVATLPRGRSNWLKNHVVERLAEATDVPITPMVVDLRLDVTLDPPEEIEAAVETLPSLEELHTFLKQRIEGHVSEPDEQGHIRIGIFEAPDQTAAIIRNKIAEHRVGPRKERKRWVGVTVRRPAPDDDG